MNKNVRLKKISPWLTLIVSFCLSTAGAFTETGNTAATTGGTTSGSSAQTSYVMPSGGGNASSSGSNTSGKQAMGAIMNIAAGGMYAGICSSCPDGGCWACPMIPLAMAAASGLGSASGKSGSAGIDMAGFDPSAGGIGAGSDGAIDPLTGQPTASGAGGGIPRGSPAITKGLQDLKNQLTKVGVKISPDGKTMTTPDGRKFDMSNGGGNGSKEDLMAMGMTAAEADAAMAASGKFAKEYASKFAQMKQLDGAGGGGGGRSTASDVAAGSGGAADMYGWDRDARNRNARNKNKISGLTKKFGDDTIGVSGDNIFEMVTRRYKARDEKNDFLKD